MPRCMCGGYLADAGQPLPIDPTEHDVPYLTRLGCSRVRCVRCGVMVRNAPGLAFNTKDAIEQGTLATLYELPDLLESGLIHRASDAWRLYLCRCDRYLAVYEAPLAPDDPDDSANKPWHCDDHPLAALPQEIGGERITSEAELRDLTRRGLHGFVPAGTREVDREAAFWLLRLHSRLAPQLATAVAEVAAETIEDPDLAARSASLRFLFFNGTDQMRERVFTMLTSKRELLAAPIDVGINRLDTTLEDTAWRVVGPLLASDGLRRTHARTEALAGRTTRALYIQLAKYDSAWLLTKIEELAHAAPGSASDLLDSFVHLPRDRWSAEHDKRVHSTLIGEDEPVDEIRKIVHEQQSIARTKIPVEGALPRLAIALPRLKDGTDLELEITPAGEYRQLSLRVGTPDGTWVTRALKHGSVSNLLTFLGDKRVAERILFQSLEARPMTLDRLLAQPGPLLPAWELNDRVIHTVRVHRVGPGGAALVGRADVDPKEREATNNKLHDRGLRVGNAYYGFVWVIDGAGCGVWSKTKQLAEGTRDQLRIGGETLCARDIKRVETFVDPDNWGHRGVRLSMDGREVVVAEENVSTENNPEYSGLDLDWEIMWAELLGRDLAAWLGVPHADRHHSVANKPQLDVYGACCALADKIASVPARGEFEFVFQPIGSTEGSGDVVLRLAPYPDEDELRFVELRVYTPSGKSWLGRWIAQGTNTQIERFLRNVRTPATITIGQGELLRELARDEYG